MLPLTKKSVLSQKSYLKLPYPHSPPVNQRKEKKHFVNNKELQEHSNYAKMAWKRWCNAGRPRSGHFSMRFSMRKMPVREISQNLLKNVEQEWIESND